MGSATLDLYRARWAVATCTAGTLLAGGQALAGGVEQSFSAPMTVERDSNVGMSASNRNTLTRTILTPTYGVRNVDGRDEYRFDLGLRVERTSNQQVSGDRNDPNLGIGWTRESPTGSFGLTAKYDEVSSRSSEMQATGLTSRAGTQKTTALGGNWRGEVSERSYWTADAEYKQVGFNNSTLNGFDNTSAGVAWNYQWSAGVEPFVRFGASRYEPRSTGLAGTSNYNLLGGVKVKLDERFEWSAQAGPSHVTGGNASTGLQTGMGLRYRGERHDFSVDGGRSVDASGAGGFLKSDQLKGAWSWAYDELSRVGADVSWQDTKGNVPNTMRQVGLWAGRELSPFWNARFSLGYKERRQAGQATATGSVVGVTFVYSHPSF